MTKAEAQYKTELFQASLELAKASMAGGQIIQIARVGVYVVLAAKLMEGAGYDEVIKQRNQKGTWDDVSKE